MNQFNKRVNSLLRDLKNGDVSKQKELFDLTYNFLKIIALIYAVDKNDCEDILIESYYRAFTYIASFDSAKDGYNWLCKIVQNVAYNFNNKTEMCVSLDSIAEVKSFSTLESDIIDAQTLIYEIKQLDKEDQYLLNLKFWENKTYREIAKVVNKKKSTIHKKILELIERLKEKF